MKKKYLYITGILIGSLALSVLFTNAVGSISLIKFDEKIDSCRSIYKSVDVVGLKKLAKTLNKNNCQRYELISLKDSDLNFDLKGVEFSESSLDNSIFQRNVVRASGFSNLSAVNLRVSNSNFSNVTIDKVSMDESQFLSSSLSDVRLINTTFNGSKFLQVKLSNVSLCGNLDFSRALFSGVEFKSLQATKKTCATKSEIKFIQANLRTQNLSGFLIDETVSVDFSGADLRDADLSKLDMKLGNWKFDRALYNANTKFPDKFSSQNLMRLLK